MIDRVWTGVLDDLAEMLGGPRAILIGAAALELMDHLDVQTSDRDLAIVLDEEDLLARMDAAPDWTHDPRQAQRWQHRSGVLVDLIPASAEAVRVGLHVWPDGAVMSLVGFRHLLARAQKVPQLRRVEVASLPSIALLKMAAYLDRPAERAKDLRHLAQLLDRYLATDSERLWLGPAAEMGYFNEDASAFLLGRDLHEQLDYLESDVVIRFVGLLLDPDREHHRGRMATVAGGTMRRDAGRVAHRVGVFAEGFEGAKASSPRGESAG